MTAKKFAIVFVCLLITGSLCLVNNQNTATVTASASGISQESPHLDLGTFLSDLNLTFDEYLDLFASLESQQIMPHHLHKNIPRYLSYQNRYPALPYDKIITYVNIDSDYDAFVNVKEVPNPDAIYLLVNSHHKLDESSTPTDLTQIQYSHKLREEAAEAFLTMRDDLGELGLSLHVVSSYRSYSSQAELHRRAVRDIGQIDADRAVARAGHSEHQTGLSLDFLQQPHSGRLARANFQDTPQYQWLTENAHRYGFILRYPEEFAHTHGYMYEPWHWRYVGADIATAMYNMQIGVYEEFYGKYLASDVLHNIKNIITMQQAQESAALERERQEAEAALLQAQQEAEAALARQAELEAQQKAVQTFPDTQTPPEVNTQEALPVYSRTLTVAVAITITAISGIILDLFGVFSLKNGKTIGLLGEV